MQPEKDIISGDPHFFGAFVLGFLDDRGYVWFIQVLVSLRVCCVFGIPGLYRCTPAIPMCEVGIDKLFLLNCEFSLCQNSFRQLLYGFPGVFD